MSVYFVAKRKFTSESFKVVHPEVKTRTIKGYPVTFELQPLPAEYETWEEALDATEKLNEETYHTPKGLGPCLSSIW